MPTSDKVTHRAVSCAFIKESGGFAVKIHRGSKAAAKDWNPRANSEAISRQVLSALEHSQDNIGVHFHGRLVDVDIDAGKESEEALEDVKRFLLPALDMFLPECVHVWGRESRPRTHRAYLIEGEEDYNPLDYPVIRRIQRISEAKVELRGGAKSRGEYTVLPGSIHPDKEKYLWDNKEKSLASPSVVPLATLIKGIRLAGAVAVIAPHWVEGMRQELTMAIAGFMHRAKDLTQSIDKDIFGVDREDAQQLLEVLMEVTGDDSADVRMRRKAFDSTWRKAEQGTPVTGATTLAQLVGDNDIIAKLYTLMSDSPEVAEIDNFVSRFVIWQGPAKAIDKKVLQAGGNQPFMSHAQFAFSYGHMFVDTGKKGVKKRKLLPDMLWSMSAATRVIGLTFAPTEGEIVTDREGDKLNQWSGFAIDPYPSSVSDKEIQQFLDYINLVLCNRNERFYSWIVAWIADMFKNPGHKAGTALVLVGRSGVGKSFLGENILGPIIGGRHYSQTNSIENITNNFNAAYANQILIQCDEALSARQRQAAARLKALITDGVQRVEPKGVDAYFTPLHARFLFTSNETEDAIHLDQGYDDRRYTVLEVSNIYKDRLEEYWLPFLEWLEQPDIRAKIHRFLLDHTYDESMIRLPLRSKAEEKMQQRSWDAVDGWLATMVSRGRPLDEECHEHWFDAPYRSNDKSKFSKAIDRREWPRWISWIALERDFERYRKTLKTHNEKMNSIQLSIALRERGLYDAKTAKETRQSAEYYKTSNSSEKVLTKVRLRQFTTLEAVKDYLSARHGFISSETDLEKIEIQSPLAPDDAGDF